MRYFSHYREEFDFGSFADVADSGLRECQLGAYWAVNSHFTTDPDEPALVSLPTGAGKTALMMILAFGFEADRVLVVTASDVLRTQTADKFASLDGLTDAGAVPDNIDKPSVEKLTERMTDDDQWSEVDSDVVVTLPHNISTVYDSEEYNGKIKPPDEDKFDLVVFDEAHHIRAPSWMELLETFENTRRVLLTATPFRRDRQTLPGKLVYHYSLNRAMDDGLYQQLKLRQVDIPEATDSDRYLAKKAREALDEIQAHFSDAKLLVRTGSIDEADSLVSVYNQAGLDVEPIHSDRTQRQNKRILDRLNENDIEGVISVGMLGEGIDNPDLKVAVLHEPPKSFPYTLQLIGRVTRPIEEEVNAVVIADPDELRKENVGDTVRQLYHEDQGWEELVPELVQTFVDAQGPLESAGSGGNLRGINEGDLQPFLSTTLYEVNEESLNFLKTIDLGEDINVFRLSKTEKNVFLGLITRSIEKPAWGTRTPLSSNDYHLHLYYFHSESDTLFESTTSDELAKKIRKQVVSEDIEIRRGDTLVRVLQSDNGVEYQVAGLANALGPSRRLPSYKMLLGDRVEGAVRPSDTKAFIHGHAVAKIDGETVGMSGEQGSVWASRREGLDGFKSWCESIGRKLLSYTHSSTAQGLGLGEITRLSEFPECPFMGILNPELYRWEVSIDSKVSVDLEDAVFSSFGFIDNRNEIMEFEFTPNEEADPIEGAYDITADEWKGDITDCTFIVDDGERSEIPAETFLKRYPPYFYTNSGQLIYGARSHSVKREFDKLPDDSLVDGNKIDWEDCVTWLEYNIEGKVDDDDYPEIDQNLIDSEKVDIHQWTQTFIETNGADDQIIYYDHGTGEIADYVQIEPENQQITYYHCKAAKKSRKSGARLSSIRDVVEQVLRSVSWIADSRLPSKIIDRKSTQNSKFIANEDAFDNFRENFTPGQWDFTVVIVHPGIDHEKVRQHENVNTVLLTCMEWLQAAGAELRIIGDPNNQVQD